MSRISSPRQHSCRPLNLCAASPLWPPSTRRCPTLARSSPFSTWHRMGRCRRPPCSPSRWQTTASSCLWPQLTLARFRRPTLPRSLPPSPKRRSCLTSVPRVIAQPHGGGAPSSSLWARRLTPQSRTQRGTSSSTCTRPHVGTARSSSRFGRRLPPSCPATRRLWSRRWTCRRMTLWEWNLRASPRCSSTQREPSTCQSSTTARATLST
mmetsp:Transcript_27322/g.83037  ORF Transcript_27322/g.83037 Transcript_27322/m.83037 type:complete len:209 (-) Transcript_27322:428-1054(-)